MPILEVRKSRYIELVDFLWQQFVSSVVWESGDRRRINTERKRSRNSDNYPFCSRIPLLRNSGPYLNRSILLSTFCLLWYLCLRIVLLNPGKITCLDNLPIMTVLFNVSKLPVSLCVTLRIATSYNMSRTHRFSSFIHCSIRFLFLQKFIFLNLLLFRQHDFTLRRKTSEKDWFICIHDVSVILKKSCLVLGKEENLICWNYSNFLQSLEF